ncbi:general secretion pathway protein GspM [Desulfobacterales bacterium HSG17]|nr:general secretion pathway protein GspM [Desulfobacterales bacterium HSG17]
MFNLAEREKNILIGGIIFVILFFGFQLGIVPVFDKRDDLGRILVDRQKALEELLVLQKKFSIVSSRFDTKAQALAQRKEDFSLFSFLDSLIQQSGIKDNVAYMKPVVKKLENSKYMLATVKIKFQGVYLKEFTDFLYLIESSENGVNVTSLSLLKSGSKSGKVKLLLDAVIETQILKFKDKV